MRLSTGASLADGLRVAGPARGRRDRGRRGRRTRRSAARRSGPGRRYSDHATAVAHRWVTTTTKASRAMVPPVDGWSRDSRPPASHADADARADPPQPVRDDDEADGQGDARRQQADQHVHRATRQPDQQHEKHDSDGNGEDDRLSDASRVPLAEPGPQERQGGGERGRTAARRSRIHDGRSLVDGRAGRGRRLHHHEAAVDGEHLARDEPRLVRREERDRVGDLLGRPEPPERRPRDRPRP